MNKTNYLDLYYTTIPTDETTTWLYVYVDVYHITDNKPNTIFVGIRSEDTEEAIEKAIKNTLVNSDFLKENTTKNFTFDNLTLTHL